MSPQLENMLNNAIESAARKIHDEVMALRLAPQNEESQNVARIDWSKAPEGATHYCPVRKTWLKQGEHCIWLSWSPFGRVKEEVLIGWTFCHPPEDELSLLTPAWSGEGHPPVGTVCEVTTNDGHNWRPVKIIFFDDYITMIGQADGKVNRELLKRCDADVAFRPIRTPELIAADERESGIQALKQVFDSCSDDLMPTSNKYLDTLFGAIYDAGWRKP